jgi:hypothetical protein
MKNQCEICGEKDGGNLIERTSFSNGKATDNKIICLKCLQHELTKEND